MQPSRSRPAQSDARASSRNRPGRALALLALAAVLAASIAGTVWSWKTRVARRPTPSPLSSMAARPAKAAGPVLAASADEIQRIVSETPLLDAASANALVRERARQGQVVVDALDSAVVLADVGFGDLDAAAIQELGRLLDESWQSRPAADGRRIQAYLRSVRGGEPVSLEESQAGRALFVEGIRRLPLASRARVQALFGRAVEAGILHQQQAEERVQRAALVPPSVLDDLPTPTPARESAPPPPAVAAAPQTRDRVAVGVAGERGMASAGSDRGGALRAEGAPYGAGAASSRGPRGDEAYWRARATDARAAVAAAERRVRELERDLALRGHVLSGPLGPACQVGLVENRNRKSLVDSRSREGLVCNSDILHEQAGQRERDQLEAARAAVKRAQDAFPALEEEARKAGALPGWLR